MISSFSPWVYLIPGPDSRPAQPRFVEPAYAQSHLCQHLFQLGVLTAQVGDLGTRGPALGVALQTTLAGLQELLGPVAVEGRTDAFTTAQLGDGLFTAGAFQNDADLFLGRELAAGLALDLADDVFRGLYARPWYTPSIARD